MRLAVLTWLVAAGALCALAAPASADTKVLVRARTYDIMGNTGRALVDAMDRKGPKQGFTTRAIAQTGYTVDWNVDVSRNDGICSLQRADGTLKITYTFPHLASAVSPALYKRWERFFAGARAHEHTHGRIARKMMRVTEKSITGLAFADNWFCTRTHREAKRRIDAIYAQYEAKQIAFDVREHRDGGHVEHLIDALVGWPD